MSQSRKKSRSRSTKGNSSTNAMNTSSTDPDAVLKKLDTLRTKTKQEQRSVANNNSTKFKIFGVFIILVMIVSGVVLMNQFHLLKNNSSSLGANLSSGSKTNTSLTHLIGGFLTDTASKPLLSYGKVFIVFTSAEFCSSCAVERWAIVMALKQFGTFSGLKTIVTPKSDGSIPSYTFYQSTYTSQKVKFDPAELESLNKTPLMSTDQIQQILMAEYDPTGNIPFLDIGGTSFMLGPGPSLNRNDFSGKTFSYVQAQIDTRSGTLYNEIKTESNYIVQAINFYLALATTTTVSTTTNTTTTTTSNTTAFG